MFAPGGDGSVGPSDRFVWVAEQRKAEAQAFGEGGGVLLRIDADPHDFGVGTIECDKCTIQLDELFPAVWSPLTAVEHHH